MLKSIYKANYNLYEKDIRIDTANGQKERTTTVIQHK